MSLLNSLSHLLVDDGDCLLWRAGCTGTGHPMWRIGGRNQLVRRALWADTRGPIPAGKVLRVTCGMPRCCNLAHCVAVTRQAVAVECAALGLMGGLVRSAKIAATKRRGPQAKLTEELVRQIRSGEESDAACGRRLGLNTKTIWSIRRHRRWREYGCGPMAHMAEVLA